VDGPVKYLVENAFFCYYLVFENESIHPPAAVIGFREFFRKSGLNEKNTNR